MCDSYRSIPICLSPGTLPHTGKRTTLGDGYGYRSLNPTENLILSITFLFKLLEFESNSDLGVHLFRTCANDFADNEVIT